MKFEIFERELSPRRKELYRCIQKAGPNGIEIQDVHEKLYPGKSSTTLRTAVYYINQAIKPIRIKRKKGRFYIELLEE